MSNLNWPSELPKPSRKGYSAQSADNRAARAAKGPPSYRRSFSLAARKVQLSILITRVQKAVFDDFYDATTKGGMLPFNMPDPVTDGWALLDDTGAPLTDQGGVPILVAKTDLCLFGEEPPVETIQGVRFIVSFSVWVLP